MTVIAFVKIIAGIRKSKELDKYRRSEELNAKMPNY